MSMVFSRLKAGIAGLMLALLAPAPGAAQDLLSRELPIALDADSSEIDRGNDRKNCERVHILPATAPNVASAYFTAV